MRIKTDTILKLELLAYSYFSEDVWTSLLNLPHCFNQRNIMTVLVALLIFCLFVFESLTSCFKPMPFFYCSSCTKWRGGRTEKESESEVHVGADGEDRDWLCLSGAFLHLYWLDERGIKIKQNACIYLQCIKHLSEKEEKRLKENFGPRMVQNYDFAVRDTRCPFCGWLV